MASPSQVFTTIIVRRDNGHPETSSHIYIPLSTAESYTYAAQPVTTSQAIPGPGTMDVGNLDDGAIDAGDSTSAAASGTPYTSKECGLIAGVVLSLVALIVILVELAIAYWRVQERRMGSRGRVPKIRWRSPRLRELELEEAKKKLKEFNVPAKDVVRV